MLALVQGLETGVLYVHFKLIVMDLKRDRIKKAKNKRMLKCRDRKKSKGSQQTFLPAFARLRFVFAERASSLAISDMLKCLLSCETGVQVSAWL